MYIRILLVYKSAPFHSVFFQRNQREHYEDNQKEWLHFQLILLRNNPRKELCLIGTGLGLGQPKQIFVFGSV